MSGGAHASLFKKALCWGVHFYTALGIVAAGAMAVCIVQGDAASLRWAFVWMFIATIIDATDGTMARAVNVKKVLPGFDGRRLDDIIDFHTYTFLPLLLLWRANVVPPGWDWSLVAAAMASLYGFCQTEAKTADGYFLGFPSYWNLVAFYLWMLPMPGWVSVTVLLVLALLTFVPARYLYPSQRGKLNMFTNVLGAVWAALLIWIFVRMPDESTTKLTIYSLFFPVFYMVVSWAITVKVWLAGGPTDESAEQAQ